MAQDKIEVDKEALAALVRIWNHYQPTGSPEHCHQVPGRWDGDRRHKKGSICRECKLYDKMRQALKEAE